MEYVKVKNLEKYHPGYVDRNLIWCKVYFNMLNSEPNFELLGEVDKWRFIAFIMLQLQIKGPVPLNREYLSRKGFDFKKRPISLSLIMFHSFIVVCGEKGDFCNVDIYIDIYIEKRERESKNKVTYPPYVELTQNQTAALIIDYGRALVGKYIEKLNLYIEQIGVTKARNKYKSHNAVIRNWLNKDGMKKIIHPKAEAKGGVPKPDPIERKKVSKLISETAKKLKSAK